MKDGDRASLAKAKKYIEGVEERSVVLLDLDRTGELGADFLKVAHAQWSPTAIHRLGERKCRGAGAEGRRRVNHSRCILVRYIYISIPPSHTNALAFIQTIV